MPQTYKQMMKTAEEKENLTNTQHEIGAMTVDQFQTACETNNIDCDSIDDMVYDLAKALTKSKSNERYIYSLKMESENE